MVFFKKYNIYTYISKDEFKENEFPIRYWNNKRGDR